VLREARELGVDLEVDARRHEREALEQPLDVRIGALERLQPQPARDLRELARELGAHLADVVELAVVVLEQPRIHQR